MGLGQSGGGRDRWFGDLQTTFGIRSNTYSGHIEEFSPAHTIRKTESSSGKGLPTPYKIISNTYRNSASCGLTEPCGGSQLTEASITP